MAYGDNLSSDSISTSKRIGEKQDDKVRMKLVIFKHFKDKLKLFSYREELRDKGIRISSDLTYLQRQELYKLKRRGIIKMANCTRFQCQNLVKVFKLAKRPGEMSKVTTQDASASLDTHPEPSHVD